MSRRSSVIVAEPQDFSRSAMEILGRVADVRLEAVGTEGVRQALRDHEVFWFRLGHRIGEAVFTDGMRCRIIATPVTGLDHIDLEACEAHGVRVMSLRGETEFLKEVRATAEHTVGLALALLRQIPTAATSVKEGHWDRDRFRGRELYGKTAGVIGVGRLGNIVADLLGAFGMSVIGYDPRVDLPAGVERVESLEELLGRADVVSLHASYEQGQGHLLGAEQLMAMKPGSILINTARGGLVDEVALLAQLRSGHIGGCALDVLEAEPQIGKDHPLVTHAREHSNLLITPHLAGNTWESFEKTEVFLAEAVAGVLAVG